MPVARRQSLAVKIPVVLSVLLVAALAAMSAASYFELRTALIEMATMRLQQAANQMANVFGLSSRQRIAAMKQLMDRAEVRDFLRTRDPARLPALDDAAKGYLGTAANIANIELWDRAGKRLFAFGAVFEEVAPATFQEFEDEFGVNDAAIGRMRVHEQDLRYPVGGAIVENGETLGYVVERRRISNPAQSRQTIALLTGLIGNEATMVIGNVDGSTWSDLATPLRDVPIHGHEPRLWDYQRAGMRRTLAWATPIDNTPWMVAIEFPRDVVLAPSQRFLIRSVALAATVLLITVVAGLILSRRLTTPLVAVTEAAKAVAQSKPHVQVQIDRDDEIGSLAESFNIMSQKVEQARTDLELRVELRTAELRAANRELEAFSYSVSHDLRAPLRAIAGFVQIIGEDHADKLDQEARRHLDRVKVNARRMGQLIDDLLSFSQIGRTTILRQTVDLTAMATAAAQEAIVASGRPIELSIDPLPPAYGEAALLTQVFTNLVSNAVKFTAKTEAPAIFIGSKNANGETIYFVRDNGVGFDDRYAEKLFGVFQRLHRQEEFEGTGVGLAIVHRIISRHGGRVWAEGKMNAGATFYFTLPSSAQSTESKPCSQAFETKPA